MTALNTTAVLRSDLAHARCDLLHAQERLRDRQPLIESELLARFCGGDSRRLGETEVDRTRQLAVLLSASEEMRDLREAVQMKREAVMRASAELGDLLDARRDLERQTLERLADAIVALASTGLGVARDAALSDAKCS